MAGRLCRAAADLPPDDLLQDVFLRLPPEPGHLHAASLVCRRWRRLVRDPAFLRRFRRFHRAPPVLGHFQNNLDPPRRAFFLPAAGRSARLRPPPFLEGLASWVLDCRHGRALLYDQPNQMLVLWDPMAEDAIPVRPPPDVGELGEFTAVIVCGCAAGHDDCHSSPFRIVFVDNDDEDTVSACIYSSETGVWGDWVPIEHRASVSQVLIAIVGDSVYLRLGYPNHIIRFGLHSQSVDEIELPRELAFGPRYLSSIELIRAENGSVGFVGVDMTTIEIWSCKIDLQGVPKWALLRAIDTKNLTLSGAPAGNTLMHAAVVGFAEESDVLFLQSIAGIIMINLRSMELKKVPEANGVCAPFVYPYASFYTRGRDIVGIDDRDE
ncbi:hypothetical protein ACP4OV_003818 [Aristida adscensionis]